MRRVLVIGNSGGGKSTLARRLGAALDLPVIHLDMLFWKPGWVESDRDDYRQRIMVALQAPAWICDGQAPATFHLRMPLADTIVWIDLPRLTCLRRAIQRAVRYRNGGRPDMTPGCREKIDLAFYRYIWTFERERVPQIEAALAAHASHAQVHRLRSDREIAAFLAEAQGARDQARAASPPA